jgi:hypothetical protein
MSFYPKKLRSTIDFLSTVAISGTAITSTAAELNKMHGVTSEPNEINLLDFVQQTLVADGPITVKNGICKIAKTVEGVVAATLADPTNITDDLKHLVIVSGQAQANTVTSASSFGGGGGGEDVITFSGAIGDTVELIAWGGKWYILGGHQFAVA